jgi:predicted nucleic acid-binding protein
MPAESTAFIDTNVLIYLLSSDELKATRAEQVMESGGVISVQVLNEFTNVARRKLSMSWEDIHEFTHVVRSICTVRPLTDAIYDQACQLAERYGFSVYDAMIVASALDGGCKQLLSEDMKDGLKVEKTLIISNPF